ncbi:Shr3 amino acid permease chaperone [Phellopilus nigrolimitatus]|nr:Shr3 amino acid permease chaperone [Phellopilus nigrolimitatus]
MGFRLSAVLASVCFVAGTLFVCFTVDQKLLYRDVTEQSVEDGFFFYTTFYNAPLVIKTLLHTVVGIGILGLIGKLHKWDECALFFDGSSLAAYVFATGVYLAVSIPALRTIVDPIEGVDTREDRIEAMRVLAAGNSIIMILLGAILCLQGGEEYARRYEAKVLAKFEESQKAAGKAGSPNATEKKKQ